MSLPFNLALMICKWNRGDIQLCSYAPKFMWHYFLQSSAKLLNGIAYADIFIIFHVSTIFLLSPLFLYLVYWSAIYWNKVIYHKQQQFFTTVVWTTTTKMPCFALASHLKDIWFTLPRQLSFWTKNKKIGLDNQKICDKHVASV